MYKFERVKRSPYTTRLPLGIGIVYAMIYFPHLWIVKIGYTGKSVKARAKSVSKAAPGWAVPVAIVVIPFAWHVEQGIHFLIAPLRWRFYKGDGKSETFLFPAHVLVVVLMAVSYLELWAVLQIIQ